MQIPNDKARAAPRREAVQKLLLRKSELQVSVWTVGRYLPAGGLAPQRRSAF